MSETMETDNVTVMADENMKNACSVIGSVYDKDAAIKLTVDNPVPMTVSRTITATGFRISTQNIEQDSKGSKIERDDQEKVSKVAITPRMSFDDFLKSTNTQVMTTEEYLKSQMKDHEVQNKKETDFALGNQVASENEVMCSIDESLNVKIKQEDVAVETVERTTPEERWCKEPPRSYTPRMSFDDFLKSTNTQVMTTEEYLKSQVKDCEVRIKKETDFASEKQVASQNEVMCSIDVKIKQEEVAVETVKRTTLEERWCKEQARSYNQIMVKVENPIVAEPITAIVPVKKEPVIDAEPITLAKAIVPVKEEAVREILRESFIKKFKSAPVRGPSSQKLPDGKKQKTENQKPCPIPVEDGEFPEEPDWFLVGRSAVTALSTTKGRKLVDNEIVHFVFPSTDWKSNGHWIVRFSTKRYGEIGRLPMEWGKCVVPLVNSGKVKFFGRCVAAPANLSMMQDIILYVSFYVHRSIFIEDGSSSWGWKLETVNIDSTIYPLLTLFKLLKIQPYQRAEFTPEELNSRKRLLNLENAQDEAASMLPIVKRRQGCQQYPEQSKDEQAVSESSMNKIVGAAESYDLEEMTPPSNLTCSLRSYQKQALYWMSELEKGIDVEEAAKTLHPCWAAYKICDERASSIYVNIFSGEATTKFPTATQMARGGILADAMGLGKTVMTIALILKSPGHGSSNNQGLLKDSPTDTSSKPKGGTLIVCPMALLSQWKDELETHSEADSISIFVHYGGGRSTNPKLIAEPDVVLTTYGVLSSAYKYDEENSIFHRVDWYRVVLDEAHTIKSWKTQGARAAFTLSSHCRWCLTGTPIQNNLEDLFSLLCFLHVEPWCNWAWWNKLIQKPYENGDPRGLRLIKAILRPLMLRRTKESKDKKGRPILVLPPTDIQIIECEQSEAERDFYDALFKRSKVQFDQFVAQGKVLHNYANILELLLRLRQCCNHPYLVMSRGDSQKFADLSKLAKRFLDSNSDSTSSAPAPPSRAYVEEVVDGIRRGDNSECPICLESADDAVLTPCAHRMCRECLLSSWRTPAAGLCPICRQILKKTDLITCPSQSKFQVDIEKNWKESSKVSSLLSCLEGIGSSGSGEKSIVFSQWTTFLDLLEIPLKKRRIGYLRYDGGLSQKQRERVLNEFNDTNEKMVLLMSLRAGGVGLNLTAASNVFLMDPWWNPAVEEQAIMRIHRIGQKRTVSVRRFIAKDTVEERMQQVQARKQRMIAGALTDEEVRSARIEELKMLFR